MRSLLGAFVLCLAACGGPTGIEIRIDPPANAEPGVDFNAIFVQVTDIDGKAQGETYPVTALTERPYLVYVWAGERNTTSVKIQVQIKKDGQVLPEGHKIEPSVVFKPGEIVQKIFAF